MAAATGKNTNGILKLGVVDDLPRPKSFLSHCRMPHRLADRFVDRGDADGYRECLLGIQKQIGNRANAGSQTAKNGWNEYRRRRHAG